MHSDDIVRSITSATGFMTSAGVEVVHTAPGIATLRVLRKPELLQFNGYFHGGVIAGLADHAAGAAATTALPEGKIAVTIDLHINYLAPADGPAIVASAKAVSIGQTICVVSVEVLNGSAQVAEGSSAQTRAQAAEGGSATDALDLHNAASLCAIATVTLRVVKAPVAKLSE